MHYNGYPAAEINGGPAPGFSSGQAQAAIAGLLGETLPNGMTFEWTELAYQELLAGNTMLLDLPALRAAGLPGAGRAVRELVAAAGVILIVPMCCCRRSPASG